MISDSESVPLHKNEGLKEESNFLRGQIVEDFADTSTGGVTESSIQLLKFHGSYLQDDRDLRRERRKQKLEKAFSFMIRVRVPGGIASAAQWLAMDDIAEMRANGTLKLTTRQAFQLHGVLKGNVKPAMQGFHDALMDSISACGDVNRNVMCNPNPFESELHEVVQKDVIALSNHLTPKTRAYHEIWLDEKPVYSAEDFEEPIYGKTYLPRKFKVAFAIPPHNDVDILTNDLGYIAIIQDGKLLGYNVTVGGGMGMDHGKAETFPCLAKVLGFITPDQVTAVGEAVVTTQRDFGDRTNRKHARLKYTIEDRGIDWFRGEVEKRSGVTFGEAKPYTFTTLTDRYGWVKGTNGKWFLTLFIMSGRVKDEEGYPMRTGLRAIAELGKCDFRLTANQNLTLGNIDEADKPAIEALVQEFKLDEGTALGGLRKNAMSCVALPTCGLALAESERYLPDLVEMVEGLFDEVGLKSEEVTIRITGCPNGCGRPYMAEIGLVGRAPGKYNIYLGGGFKGERLNKLYKNSVKTEELPELLKPIIGRYAKERNEGEHFGDFCIRAGVIAATSEGNNFHENLGEV